VVLGCHRTACLPCRTFCSLHPGDTVSRLVALEGASSICAIVLLSLAEAYRRVTFVDLSLTLALLSFGAGLVFARFLERWL